MTGHLSFMPFKPCWRAWSWGFTVHQTEYISSFQIIWEGKITAGKTIFNSIEHEGLPTLAQLSIPIQQDIMQRHCKLKPKENPV
jgi:hypothetical protein